MKRFALAGILAGICFLGISAHADTEEGESPSKLNHSTQSSQGPLTPFQKEAQKQSPSFQSKKWTGTQTSYESNFEMNYIGNSNQNVGLGADQKISESYLDVRQEFMRHTLLAFLVQGGIEYQHMGFGHPTGTLIPNRLDMLAANVGIDFHWSEKDLLQIQARPGLYSEFEGQAWQDINIPIEVGYTRVVSNSVQWVAGFSVNTWRKSRYLGAGGVRWQINDRWKIKAYLPTPDIEYYARPDLTLLLGADLRGETYRVGPHFGDAVGHPSLNNALVDYQEVRVGPGFSWNVKPLIEVNFMTGYMVGRSYDFHNNGGPTLNGSGAPFVNLAVHALFKWPGEPLIIPQRSNISVHDIFNYL